jgi:GNAT superfamily N-acetyltransferase
MLIRKATPDDALNVARVHVRAWQVGYRGLLPDAYLDRLRPEDRAVRYTFGGADPKGPATIVAVDDSGATRGFATTGPDRDGADAGELCALCVDPEFWSRGVGQALIAAARERLVGEGYGRAVLWVLEGNARADRFYRADGWSPDGARRSETIWGIAAADLRYRRSLG